MLTVALDESGAASASERLAAAGEAGVEVHAPTLLRFEFASGLAKALVTGRVKAADLDGMLNTFASAPITFHPSADLVRSAIDIAFELGQRNAYDAFYLALARRLQAELWTADRAMASHCERFGIAGQVITT